jgi:polar amino acid transport system substrate-binding protein
MVALFDSTITFHAQYQQRHDITALVDLLVLDATTRARWAGWPRRCAAASRGWPAAHIDVVNAVAKKAGLEVKFVNTPWEGIFNALDQGDRDLLVSAITVTDERRQTMDFSQPYFDARQLIAVRSDSPVAKFNDIKTLKVGVQNGTTGDEVVGKLLGKSSTSIKRFESTPLALKELEAGGVEAVVADNGVVVHYLANNTAGGFKTVSDAGFPVEKYGIAVKRGNSELLAKINQGLEGIRADGTYAKIYASHFGSESK